MRAEEILQLLPSVIRRAADDGSPLWALLGVMEGMHAPSERALAELDETCDPWRAEPRFIAYLARWLNLSELPLSPDSSRLRALIAAAATLHQKRGTRIGLLTFLELATGLKGFEIEETVQGDDGRVLPFHIRVLAPAEATAHARLIDAVVRLEKPAHVTCEVEFASRPPPAT